MKILYVGSEAAPFVATGGLGDVLGSLPAAVAAADKNADVRVVLPLHSKIANEYRSQMEFVMHFNISLAWRNLYCGILKYVKDRVTYYFIDNEYYFVRSKLYGEYDDGERYAFFCRAVLEMLPKIDFIPDILHANDWQSALCMIYLKRSYHYPNTKGIYTIHNIEYQGKYGMEILGDVFALGPQDAHIVEYDKCLNLTKGAIVCCDRLTTVSARYAEEIRMPYYAHGLSYIIDTYGFKTSGIVNGIDYVEYDPLHDNTIAANFSQGRPAGKKKCKEELLSKLGLENDDMPVVAMITRLVAHKGVDLVREVIDEAVGYGIKFVILGTGDYEYESFFRGLESRHPGRVRCMIEFNKVMAKMIYAGADIFLMPSKSEPCGLAQMIASRYGTVAVVRETGGLADTIVPFDPTSGEGNGVTFYSYNAHDMLYAVKRAVDLYNDKNAWKIIRKNAMATDFSWGASAVKYLELYKGI